MAACSASVLLCPGAANGVPGVRRRKSRVPQQPSRRRRQQVVAEGPGASIRVQAHRQPVVDARRILGRHLDDAEGRIGPMLAGRGNVADKDIDRPFGDQRRAVLAGWGVPAAQQVSCTGLQASTYTRMRRFYPIEHLHRIIAAWIIAGRRCSDVKGRVGQGL